LTMSISKCDPEDVPNKHEYSDLFK
jgi:hypothetical protein